MNTPGHPAYPWIGRLTCGTCGGVHWRIIDTPHGRVARCEACLPKLREGETVVERVVLAGEGGAA